MRTEVDMHRVFLKANSLGLTCFLVICYCLHVCAATRGRASERQERSTSVSNPSLSRSQGMMRASDKDSLLEWVDMLFLVVGAILQVKVSMIWAASRILRKLRNPVRKRMGRNLNEKHVEQRFVEMVLTLCKGRNHRYSRLFYRIYELFFISSTTWGYYKGDLLLMDSYLAIALPMMTGSFAVIGSGVVKRYEVGSVFLLAFVYGGFIFASLEGVFGVPEVLKRIGFGVEMAVIVITVLDLLYDVYGDYRGSHSDLFCTAQAFYKGNQNEAQIARFDQMKQFVRDRGAGEVHDEGSRMWKVARRRVVVDFVLYFLQCVAAIITSNNGGQFFIVARIVGLEAFEMISIFLLFLNEGLVEPTLYLRLMEHALDDDENVNSQRMRPNDVHRV